MGTRDSRLFADRSANTPRRGFTVVELLVVIGIIVLLVSLLLPALYRARRSGRSIKDQTQLHQIHLAMITFSTENGDRMPTPGIINTLPDPSGLTDGLEDYSKNTSANLYSALIARNFIEQEILYSPVEENPLVLPPDDSRGYTYDFAAYDPSADTYWDGDAPSGDAKPMNRFRTDTENGPSYSSYYHLAMCGRRKAKHWRSSGDSGIAHLSNRAPYRGQGDDSGRDTNYTRSYTLLMHGASRQWTGHVVYADNHVDRVDSFYPDSAVYIEADGTQTRDNIFDMEFDDPTPGAAADIFLTMTETASKDDVTDYQEALRD